jgi:hypothetical protein
VNEAEVDFEDEELIKALEGDFEEGEIEDLEEVGHPGELQEGEEE